MNANPFTLYWTDSSGSLGVLAVESTSCFPIVREMLGNRIKNHLELCYVVEQCLPLDAEHISLWIAPKLLLAIDGEKARQWLNHEARRVDVIAVTPKVWLAASELRIIYKEERDITFVFNRGHAMDVLRLEGPVLVKWSWIASDETALGSILTGEFDGQSTECALIFVDFDMPPKPFVASQSHRSVVFHDDSNLDQLANRFANRVLSGEERVSVAFHGGPLNQVDPNAPARTVRNATAVALLVLMLCVLGALQWRSLRYEAIAHERTAQSEEIFRSLFPKQQLPTGLLGRVESEVRRLRATKGGAGQETPRLKSCLPVAVSLWRSVPEAWNTRVDSLAITSTGIQSLAGIANSYEEVETFRESLRQQAFDVPPLSSTQTAGGFTIDIRNVKWKEPEPSSIAGGSQ